jgi:hypothetical protein
MTVDHDNFPEKEFHFNRYLCRPRYSLLHTNLRIIFHIACLVTVQFQWKIYENLLRTFTNKQVDETLTEK